jgi:glycosyltransferase involved in cell wall biosynthesis
VTCLTFCSLPYSGRGWPQTCAGLLKGFEGSRLKAVFVVPRSRARAPASIDVINALTMPLSALPWRYVEGHAQVAMTRRFASLIAAADPARTIAYFWPGVPPDLVRLARRRGLLTIREMINTFQGTAKPILDAAYARAGLPPAHTISDAAIAEEEAELGLYDYICASNAPCEASLAIAGIPAERILSTSFGWSPERYGIEPETAVAGQGETAPVKLLFAGTIGIRKGAPELLEAWSRCRIDGELTLVGNVEPGIAPLVDAAVKAGRTRVLPFTPDIGAHYRTHDVFILPTHEEGGVQVTIEAGGCGLPVITTPMGTSRLVEDGRNGIVVPAGDVGALTAAITRLGTDAPLRRELARHIREDAMNLTYDRLGARRARLFLDLLEARRGVSSRARQPMELRAF